MSELIRRLSPASRTGLLLLLATLLANLLALAPPFFVIQILNRFLASGVTSTLFALVTGTAIAILFEALLRHARFRLAQAWVANIDYSLSIGIGKILTTMDPRRLWGQKNDDTPDAIDGLDAVTRVQSAYSPLNLCTFLDAPFSLLFIIVIALISPTIGLVVGIGTILAFLLSLAIARVGQGKQSRLMTQIAQQISAMKLMVVKRNPVRGFVSGSYLGTQWHETASAQVTANRITTSRQSTLQGTALSTQALMSVVVIALGAVQALNGTLDIGALIGLNILASRALAPVSRFAGSLDQILGAQSAVRVLRQTLKLFHSNDRAHMPVGTISQLELRHVTHRPHHAAAPMYREVTVSLEVGEDTVVYSSDTGTSTALLHTILRHEDLQDGAILINGINMVQIPFDWWRSQIGHLPARPFFLAGPLRENFTAIRKADDAEIMAALQKAGLRETVEAHPDGLNLNLSPNADSLPADLRWRLGLARIIYMDPPVILIEDGVDALPISLRTFRRRYETTWRAEGRILVVATTDKSRAEAADQVVELRGTHVARTVRMRPPLADSDSARAAAQWASTSRGEIGKQSSNDESEDTTRTALLMRARRSAQAIAALACLLVVGFGAWAHTAIVDRLVLAQGEVVPTGKVQTVESLDGGVVAKIAAKENETVRAGDPILILDAIQDDADMGELSVRLAALTLTMQRLHAEADGRTVLTFQGGAANEYPELAAKIRAVFDARLSRIEVALSAHRQTIEQRQGELSEITTRIRNTRGQLEFAREQVAISADLLANDLSNRMQHLIVLRDEADLEAELSFANASQSAARAAVAQAQEMLNLVKAEHEQEIRSQLEATTQELREISNRMTKIKDTRGRRTLRAPIDGTVKALSTFSVGAVIGANETVAEIVPLDDKLAVEARLPSSEIGFVRPGMPVRLRLSGPFTVRFDMIDGHVTEVSPDTFTTDQGVPFYKLQIAVDEDAFHRGGDDFPLTIGLKVDAGLIVGERSILTYLFDPMLGHIKRALREN